MTAHKGGDTVAMLTSTKPSSSEARQQYPAADKAPKQWGRPAGQEAGNRRDHKSAGPNGRRDPQVGGPQWPAEKPASIDTDGWDPRPAGLPLYP